MSQPDPLIVVRAGPYSFFCVCSSPEVCDDASVFDEVTASGELAELPVRPGESDSAESDGGESLPAEESELDMLPREFEGQVSELPWLASILEHLWPKVDKAVGKIVRETVEPKIKDMLPSWFSGVYFKKFTMGERPPTFGPIRVYRAPCMRRDRNGRGLEVQIDVEMENQVDIELSFLEVAAGIRTFKLRGTLVMRLDPLVEQLPIVGGVAAYFRDPPEIEVHFSGIADIADWGMIAGSVHRAIDSCIADAIVLPNLVAVNMFDDENIVDTAQIRDPKPVGVLRVTALSASDLVGADWHLFDKSTSDPYVRLKLSADEWSSSVVESTCNPVWTTEDAHNFLVYDVEQEVCIQILDYGFCSNTLIGCAHPIAVKDLWKFSKQPIPLRASATDDTPSGSIRIRFEWLRLAAGELGFQSCLLRVKIDSAYMPSAVEDKVASAGLVVSAGGKEVSTTQVEPQKRKRVKAVKMHFSVEQVLSFVLPSTAIHQQLILSLVGVDKQQQDKSVLGKCSISLSEVASAHLRAMYFPRLRFEGSWDQAASAEIHVEIIGLERMHRNQFRNEMRRMRPDLAPSGLSPIGSKSFSNDWVSMEAINLMWKVLWPTFEEKVQKFVEDPNGSIAKTLRCCVAGTPFANAAFSKFKLGKSHPVFGPIKVSSAPSRYGQIERQGIEICLGLVLDSDADIEISVLDMCIGIRSLKIVGELLVRLEPLLGEKPVVGGIVFCFLDAPQLDFDFSGIAKLAGFFDNWILVGAVRHAIHSVLARSLVLPNVISCPIGTEAQGVDRSRLKQPKPLGIFRVRVVRARGLTGRHWHLFRDRTSNPYLRIGMADESWHSPIVKRTCNPDWGADAIHDFFVWDCCQLVSIEVMEAGLIDPLGNDLLGKVRPMDVAQAVSLSGQPLELFHSESSMDQECGSVELTFEWLQAVKETGTDDRCVLRIKVDEVYAPGDFQQRSLGLLARVGNVEKKSVQVKAVEMPAAHSYSAEESQQTFEIETLFYLLIETADLAKKLELLLFEPSGATVASAEIRLQFLGAGQQWLGDSLLELTGENGLICEAEVDLAVQGLIPRQPPSQLGSLPFDFLPHLQR